jgi:hypothetical protein
MTEDITSRILRLFELRVQRDPSISSQTARALSNTGERGDFGDDEELLSLLTTGIESGDE